MGFCQGRFQIVDFNFVASLVLCCADPRTLAGSRAPTIQKIGAGFGAMEGHPRRTPGSGSPDDLTLTPRSGSDSSGAPMRRVLLLSMVTIVIATAATRIRSRNLFGPDADSSALAAAVGRAEVPGAEAQRPATRTSRRGQVQYCA